MKVQWYSLMFTQLARYVPYVVANSRSKMSKYMSSMSNSLVKKCRITMLTKEMDIAKILVHS